MHERRAMARGFSFLFRGASEPVILSAEGAKDLLLGAEPAFRTSVARRRARSSVSSGGESASDSSGS